MSDCIQDALFEIFGDNSNDISQLVEGEVKVNVKYFPNLSDWIMVMLLVSVRHAIPSADNETAKKIIKFLTRNLYLPSSDHRWAWAEDQIDTAGMKGMLQKVRMELMHGVESRERL